MAYVIVQADGRQTRTVYAGPDQAVAALKRRREVGSAVWWCKYARETKMLVATFKPGGIKMFDPNEPRDSSTKSNCAV